MSIEGEDWVVISSSTPAKVLFGPAYRYECEDWADAHWLEWTGMVEIIKQDEYEETQ